MIGAIRASAQPTAPARGWAGLVSGPRKLKAVGMPISRRGTPAWRRPGMEARGEAESDAGVGNAAGYLVRPQVERQAEVFQQVRSPAEGRGGAVAVLDHPYSGAGHHDCRHGGDVHRVGPVPAGADHVHRVARAGRAEHAGQVHPDRRAQHGLHQSGYLAGGLTLGPQCHRERGDLHRGGVTGHHLAHCPGGVSGTQLLAAQQCAEQVRPGALAHGGPPSTGSRTGIGGKGRAAS